MSGKRKAKRDVTQIAIEIGNLAKNGWLNPTSDLEFVFREIEKCAVEIMKLGMRRRASGGGEG
jgi:hypothetical protein